MLEIKDLKLCDVRILSFRSEFLVHGPMFSTCAIRIALKLEKVPCGKFFCVTIHTERACDVLWNLDHNGTKWHSMGL